MISADNIPQPSFCKDATAVACTPFHFGGETVRVAIVDGEAVYDQRSSDPLLDLMAAYYLGMARYEAEATGEHDEEGYDRFIKTTYGPFLDQLHNDPPTPTTEIGAIEAIRLIHRDLQGCVDPKLIEALSGKALAYFDGRAGE